ncbi:phosphate signaling complex protein PhoU [Limnobacter parvus]|uniref:Phosphate-specific transport system accessory protein PhoU n=1 Tax=Limnobacter parvus TaxID=2939690 RepID=A0ABT1XKC0_9BURK|nr:phosphate signaling complex protein PhoU [Limnobacter parvus]MCR2746717.1 phosphate signaling complex protein PhoU [Limnobacter parvus]
MTEHTSKQYDAELESLRTRVLQMGGLVENQIVSAIEGLGATDTNIFKEVIRREQEVNQIELEIDELCNHILARRQPAAVDLRSVIVAIKMIRDLERIGDEAEKVARMGIMIADAGKHFVPKVDLHRIASNAIAMLRKVLDSYARVNAVSAAEVVKADIEVDDEFKAILRQLITFMMEDPRTISRSIEILFIAKAIERIGDHSKNMSEHVVYMVKGRDVRHQNPEAVAQEASDNS